MKKSPKPCTCVTQVNAHLAKEGQILTSQLAINFMTGKASIEWPIISTEWTGKPKRGKRLSILFCSYCPFCGKKKP